MKRINHFDNEDFLRYILSQIDMVDESNQNTNLQHTHDRVRYDPETGQLSVEEVCNNGQGSVFGREIFGQAYIPKEWNHLLPALLTQSPFWGDF